MSDDRSEIAPAITSPEPLRRLRQDDPRPWVVVIPFKGSPGGKSRLREFSETERAALALAFLQDTVFAVLGVQHVAKVVIVSDSKEARSLPRFFADDQPTPMLKPLSFISDPSGGLNVAVRNGIRYARRLLPTALVAAMPSDLPCLRSADLSSVLDRAEQFDRAFVPDSSGDGTTVITVRPGVPARPHFGIHSRDAHEKSGHQVIAVNENSGLRFDIDTVADLRSAGSEGRSIGAATLHALRNLAKALPPEGASPLGTSSSTTDGLVDLIAFERELR